MAYNDNRNRNEDKTTDRIPKRVTQFELISAAALSVTAMDAK